MTEGPHILSAQRIGDTQRSRYADHLAEMTSEGYIDQAEHDLRASLILAARIQGDLDAAVADLPKPSLPKAGRKEAAMLDRAERKARRTSWAKFRLGVCGVIVTALGAAVMLFAVPALITARPAGAPITGVLAAMVMLSVFAGLGLATLTCAWWVWLVNAGTRKRMAGHGHP